MRQPNGNRTAFVALFETTELYHQIAAAAAGKVDAYYVTSTSTTMRRLLRLGVPAGRILDLSETRRNVRRMSGAPELLRRQIAVFEAAAGLTFPSMILMSRFHRNEPFEPLLHYMGLCAARMEEFFADNGIDWVIAEPTNVVELLAYVVSRKLGIKFGQIAHARLPSDRLVLFDDIYERGFHRLEAAREDSGAAVVVEMAAWLNEFRRRPARPAYFAGQARRRGLLRLAGSAVANLSAAIREWFGQTEINDYRFLQKVELHIKPYLGALKRHAIRRIATPAGFAPRRPYIVYFLHVYPERSVDVVSPWYKDQLGVITALRRAAPSECDVLVKEHPSAAGWQTPAFYRELGRTPGIRLLGAEFDSRELMLDAALTATLSGTAAYEAALLGRAAVLFSDVSFGSLPRIERCTALSELPNLIARAMAGSGQTDDAAVMDYLLDVRRNSERAVWDGKAGLVGAELAAAFARLLCRAIQIGGCTEKSTDAAAEHSLAFHAAD